MGKVDLIMPELVRVAAGVTRNIDFKLNFNDYDAITSSGTVTLKASNSPDFSSSSVSVKTSFSHKDPGSTTWSSVSGNTIALNLQGKDLRVPLDGLGTEKIQYVKVVFTVGSKVFESKPVLYTSLTEIDFKLDQPIVVGSVRPEKIKVMDKIDAKVSSTFTIKVEVTNNANDAIPVWENATISYLNNEYYTFTNKTRVNPWAISVRYYIKKENVTDEIEISELFVAFV